MSQNAFRACAISKSFPDLHALTKMSVASSTGSMLGRTISGFLSVVRRPCNNSIVCIRPSVLSMQEPTRRIAAKECQRTIWRPSGSLTTMYLSNESADSKTFLSHLQRFSFMNCEAIPTILLISNYAEYSCKMVRTKVKAEFYKSSSNSSASCERPKY